MAIHSRLQLQAHRFFDAYYFTIPNGSSNSVTSSINLDSILGLSNLKARLYAGNVNDTTNSVTSVIENWGTTVNFSPTVGITTVVLNPISLLAGSLHCKLKVLWLAYLVAAMPVC
jgi:hypothetical protein